MSAPAATERLTTSQMEGEIHQPTASLVYNRIMQAIGRVLLQSKLVKEKRDSRLLIESGMKGSRLLGVRDSPHAFVFS